MDNRNYVWVVEYFGADNRWHPHSSYLHADDIPDDLINSGGHRIRKYHEDKPS